MKVLDHPQIKIVHNFTDLIQMPFQGLNNAICWERELIGDFCEIVSKLSLIEDITEITSDDLLALDLTSHGESARSIILSDMEKLSTFGTQPSLNLLKCYERDDELDFISTDVYSFHVDRSPIATDTFLCTYHGAPSDMIANDQAKQKIHIPEIREKLRELHDGSDQDFDEFLKEYYFDLHYQAQYDAQPINFGHGNLWRLAVDHPEQTVLPCIHRAPMETNGEYRLLLIC